MTRRLLLVTMLALGATFSLPAAALKGERVDQCIDLGADHSLRRTGAQFLYVRDGADHYRLSFVNGQCGPMAVTSKLSLDTDGNTTRICPSKTNVIAHRRRCAVSGVERIEKDDYARLTRKR